MDLQGLKTGGLYLAMFTLGSNGAVVKFSDDNVQSQVTLDNQSHYISFPFVAKGASQSVWLSLPKSEGKTIQMVTIFNAEIYSLK